MAIEVKNISYTYPGSTVTAVENVSMKIEKGERAVSYTHLTLPTT